eukprot:4034209-Lingulodinium_polyedra.AAC.1
MRLRAGAAAAVDEVCQGGALQGERVERALAEGDYAVVVEQVWGCASGTEAAGLPREAEGQDTSGVLT